MTMYPTEQTGWVIVDIGRMAQAQVLAVLGSCVLCKQSPRNFSPTGVFEPFPYQDEKAPQDKLEFLLVFMLVDLYRLKR